MLKCINCGCELIELNKNHFLHAKDVNIGTELKPFWIKSAHQTSPKGDCIYPEVKK